MEEKTQVDKWLIKLKNNKLIASVVVIFIISLAALSWGNEFLDFKQNFSNDKTTEDSIIAVKDTKVEVSKKNKNEKIKENTKKVTHLNLNSVSKISGRLLDKGGNSISKGVIIGEQGEKVITDENGFFELEIKKRPQQIKVKILFSKEGVGKKERYVGVNQTNIVLKL
jgi:hypothetical protein